MKYPHLFSPLRVNGVMLKNRVMAAPMGIPRAALLSTTNYGGLSLMDKARGGAAVVTTTNYSLADLVGEKSPFDKYARDVSREALSVMQQGGAQAMLEIPFHGTVRPDGSVDGPSDGAHFTGGHMRAMTREDMEAQIADMCRDAVAAKEFGFDMVMFHFGHDSLCSVFLSPVWNRRTDEYGGSVENRTRFAREAITAVRKAVGPDFPIVMRVSRELKVPESYPEEDMLYFIRSVEDQVDMVNVSCGMDCYGGTIDKYTANTYTHTTIFLPRMYNLDFAARVKRESKVLVSVVGGVSEPQVCEEAIAQGKVDAVMLGRQLVADPFWPEKAQEDRDEDIVPCLRCLNCYHISTEHANTQCSVNPRFRREDRVPLRLDKAGRSKRVVVIGGGPAGLKAALTAAERGHTVILLEKSDRLGGNLRYADHGDYKADLRKYREYLIGQVESAPVEVRLNTEATPGLVSALGPDALIIAVGGDFILPRIPGVEHAKQAVSVYPCLDEVKGRVVVVGGGAIGSEVALELSDRGNDVTIVEPQDALAKKSNWLYRHGLYNAMKERPAPPRAMLGASVKEIRPDGVVVAGAAGAETFLPADHVLLAVGMRPRRDLAFSFYGITPETAMVGDCKRVALVLEATNDAYFIAANL